MKAERILELEKEIQKKRNAIALEWAIEHKIQNYHLMEQKDLDSIYIMLLIKANKSIDTF